MAANGFVPGLVHVVLAILWIGLFFQNKRKRAVGIIHIMLLLFAIGILINSLFKVIHGWGF